MVTVIQDKLTKRLRLQLDASSIGYVVRNMRDLNTSVSVFEQHADCILSTGEPVGFFARNQAHDQGSIAEMFTTCGGAIFGYDKMVRLSYELIDESVARQNGFFSCLLIIQGSTATDERLLKFNEFWKNAKTANKGHSGVFHNLKRNCATVAYEGFLAAGIVEGRMSLLLDTPCSLFRHLVRCAKQKGYTVSCYLGHLGFFPRKKDERGRTLYDDFDIVMLNYRSCVV